jgi:predicted homoserine dehydrogenase-like protein
VAALGGRDVILVDSALRRREEEGNPIRVGMVGAGAMGRALALQVRTAVPGMEIVAISNRHAETAERAYLEAGADDVVRVSDPDALAKAVERGQPAYTDDPRLLCAAECIDAIWEVTGAVEFGAHVVLDAIAHGKHVVTMNAELQGTVGPLLKQRADAAGVVLTDSDGDQPGVMMNLYRFVKGIGIRPVLLGNLKGLHDPYRNPTTQEEFARRHGLRPNMATSFADGSKVSFEMALVANATGLRAGRRGLYGPPCAHVREAADLFPFEQMIDVGLVDYVVGAEPAPGVFCLGYQDHPVQQRWLHLYKLGDGPLYTFYTPYHLCHLEAPTTVARAVLFGDAAVAPHVGHVVDVVANAKRDLKAGETLDGIGFYMTYGVCENAEVVHKEGLLPMGLAEGCRVVRDVPQDTTLTYDDVAVPEGRLVDALREEQAARFCAPQAAT